MIVLNMMGKDIGYWLLVLVLVQKRPLINNKTNHCHYKDVAEPQLLGKQSPEDNGSPLTAIACSNIAPLCIIASSIDQILIEGGQLPFSTNYSILPSRVLNGFWSQEQPEYRFSFGKF